MLCRPPDHRCGLQLQCTLPASSRSTINLIIIIIVVDFALESCGQKINQNLVPGKQLGGSFRHHISGGNTQNYDQYNNHKILDKSRHPFSIHDSKVTQPHAQSNEDSLNTKSIAEMREFGQIKRGRRFWREEPIIVVPATATAATTTTATTTTTIKNQILEANSNNSLISLGEVTTMPRHTQENTSIEYATVNYNGLIGINATDPLPITTESRTFSLPIEIQILMCLFYGTLAFTAITSNMIVCYIVLNNQRMRTATNYFIVNLAVGDILMALLCIPFTFPSNLIFQSWPFGLTLCVIVSYSQANSVFISAYTMVAISIDKYIAIMYPMRLRMLKNQAKIIILVIWSAALITSLPTALLSKLAPASSDSSASSTTEMIKASATTPLPPTLGGGEEEGRETIHANESSNKNVGDSNALHKFELPYQINLVRQQEFSNSTRANSSETNELERAASALPPSSSSDLHQEKRTQHYEEEQKKYFCQESWNFWPLGKYYYSMACMILQFVLPLFVLIVTYTRIVIVVWGKRMPGEEDNARDARMARSKRKMIKMVIFCVIAFALTWLPFNALIIIGDIAPEIWEHQSIMYIWFITHYLAMCHTITNPLIYIWMNNRFRAGFKQVIEDVCKCLHRLLAYLVCYCLCFGCCFKCSRQKHARVALSIERRHAQSRSQQSSSGTANQHYNGNNNNHHHQIITQTSTVFGGAAGSGHAVTNYWHPQGGRESSAVRTNNSERVGELSQVAEESKGALIYGRHAVKMDIGSRTRGLSEHSTTSSGSSSLGRAYLAKCGNIQQKQQIELKLLSCAARVDNGFRTDIENPSSAGYLPATGRKRIRLFHRQKRKRNVGAGAGQGGGGVDDEDEEEDEVLLDLVNPVTENSNEPAASPEGQPYSSARKGPLRRHRTRGIDNKARTDGPRRRRKKRTATHAINLQMTTSDFFRPEATGQFAIQAAKRKEKKEQEKSQGAEASKTFSPSKWRVVCTGRSSKAHRNCANYSPQCPSCRAEPLATVSARCKSGDDEQALAASNPNKMSTGGAGTGHVRFGKFLVESRLSSQSTATISALTNNTSLAISPNNSSSRSSRIVVASFNGDHAGGDGTPNSINNDTSASLSANGMVSDSLGSGNGNGNGGGGGGGGGGDDDDDDCGNNNACRAAGAPIDGDCGGPAANGCEELATNKKIEMGHRHNTIADNSINELVGLSERELSKQPDGIIIGTAQVACSPQFAIGAAGPATRLSDAGDICTPPLEQTCNWDANSKLANTSKGHHSMAGQSARRMWKSSADCLTEDEDRLSSICGAESVKRKARNPSTCPFAVRVIESLHLLAAQGNELDISLKESGTLSGAFTSLEGHHHLASSSSEGGAITEDSNHSAGLGAAIGSANTKSVSTSQLNACGEYFRRRANRKCRGDIAPYLKKKFCSKHSKTVSVADVSRSLAWAFEGRLEETALQARNGGPFKISEVSKMRSVSELASENSLTINDEIERTDETTGQCDLPFPSSSASGSNKANGNNSERGPQSGTNCLELEPGRKKQAPDYFRAQNFRGSAGDRITQLARLPLEQRRKFPSENSNVRLCSLNKLFRSINDELISGAGDRIESANLNHCSGDGRVFRQEGAGALLSQQQLQILPPTLPADNQTNQSCQVVDGSSSGLPPCVGAFGASFSEQLGLMEKVKESLRFSESSLDALHSTGRAANGTQNLEPARNGLRN